MAEQKVSSLVLYQKYVDLLEYAYNLLLKYPKGEKFAMVVSIKNSMFNTVRLILFTNKIFENNQRRLESMNHIDAEIQLQKLFVRMSHQHKYINNDNYKEWSRRLDEIGSLLGGWIKVVCQKG